MNNLIWRIILNIVHCVHYIFYWVATGHWPVMSWNSPQFLTDLVHCVEREELSVELSGENVDTKSGNYPSECRLNLISFFCKNPQGKSYSFLHSEENFKGTETSRENWAIIYPWSWSLWQQSLIAWRRVEILNIRLCQTVHSSY